MGVRPQEFYSPKEFVLGTPLNFRFKLPKGQHAMEKVLHVRLAQAER
jgi:hypothetical protein